MEAKALLQSSIKGLRESRVRHLVCEYTSQSGGLVDVENVLIYNVRAGTFAHLNLTMLTFRRNWAPPPECPHGRRFDHFCEYRLEDSQSPPLNGVQFEFVPAGFSSVSNIWFDAGSAPPIEHSIISGPFGVHIELDWTSRVSPAAKLKKLLDGILCSLHSDADPNDEAVIRITGYEQQDVVRRLKSPSNSLLSYPKDKRLVRPFGDRVQWHPNDHLCEECTLVVRVSDQPRCAVTLYPLENAH